MSGSFVTCPFEECEHFGKMEFAEMGFFMHHLASNHDYIELYNLAVKKGVIKDTFEKHSTNFVVRKIAKLFTVRSFPK